MRSSRMGFAHNARSARRLGLDGRIQDARIYAEALDQQRIAGLQPGRLSAELTPCAWWSFSDEGLREKTGRFNQIRLVDDDGTEYLSYWMLWGARGIGIAGSRDQDCDQWTKLDANPVIRSTEWGVTETTASDGTPLLYGSADPSNIWKRDGHYFMLTGNLLVLNKFGRQPDAPVNSY